MQTYQVRRSKRARNILLHVDIDGSVELVVPWRVALYRAEAFVRERQAWIEQMRSRQARRHGEIRQRRLASGERLPFAGKTYDLQVMLDKGRARSSAAVKGAQVTVSARDQAGVRPALVRWYKRQAQSYTEPRADAMADRLGVWIERVHISDYKTQWGSCQGDKRRLAFSWRLCLATPAVIEYVIAHEVAHLKHHNHSKRFWAAVEKLVPDYKPSRAWLRRYGHTLIL